MQAFGRELALRPAQQAGEQAAWIAHPALLPLLPDMRHGLHHGVCAMPLDGLVEVTGSEAKPVCLLASPDLGRRARPSGTLPVVASCHIARHRLRG